MLARQLLAARRERLDHVGGLARAGRTVDGLDATVVAAAPAVYCLPGRGRRRVVVTTAALSVLTALQLRAVLAHEHAHLRWRHHLVNSVATALSRAFPGVPLLAHARREIAILAEIAADDAAGRRHDAATLAAALVRLATARAPALALGAGGHTVVHRVQRMLAPPPPLGLFGRLAGAATAIGAPAAPIVLACAARGNSPSSGSTR